MADSIRLTKTANNYIAGLLTAKVAAENLGISRRTFFRKLKGLNEDGVICSEHGNTGKPSKRKISPEIQEKILKLTKEKYFDLPFKQIAKHLKEDEDICVSGETVRKIVRKEEEENKIEIKKNPHPLRRRRNRFGELIQIDGSPHHWFGEDKPMATLIAFIDDATGKITSARFEPQEDSLGYRRAIYSHVLKYGIPIAFYSDQHSVFKSPLNPVTGEAKLTQYQRVCKMLGVETIYATTPQAKGRIERLNRTLQGRWPGELRLAGADTIEKANKVIDRLIEEFNEEFSVEPIDPSDAHIPLMLKKTRLRLLCAEWHERIISKTKTLSWDGKVIQLDTEYESLFLRGAKAIVVKYSDGKIEVYIRTKRNTRELQKLHFRVFDHSQAFEVKEYEESSKTIDKRLEQIIKSREENGYVKSQYRWGEKRKEIKKKREETTKAANLLIEKMVAKNQK